MKNVMTKLTFAAAAFVAFAGLASAQKMEANIPFAFRASGAVLPAGTYQVDMKTNVTGSLILAISSKDGGRKVLALAHPGDDARKSWIAAGDPVLSFHCGAGRCVLSDVWSTGSASAYHLPGPSLGKDEPIRTAEIPMHRVKAD